MAAAPTYVTGVGVPAVTGTIRVYEDSIPWFGENRGHLTLLAPPLSKTLGVDYFIHPISDCALGIPAGTRVVHFASNGFGLPSATAAQNAPLCQAALVAFLATGGTLIVDMGDNDPAGGFIAPGAVGTPTLSSPSPCDDATLTAAAAGHPLATIPNVLTNATIDMIAACNVAHGNLADGITLPPAGPPTNTTVLMTAVFGTDKPILAEYCFGGGRVILDTISKEFGSDGFGHQPLGGGPTFFMQNLFTYALSDASTCGGGLTDLSPAHLWIGLKNSDDQGTQFDLKVEVFKNADPVPVASGLTRCITGVTRNPSLAKLVTVPFDPFVTEALGSGDTLSLKVSTRVGTTATDAKCAGPGGSHNNARGLRLYYDSPSRDSHIDATIAPNPNENLYLHSDGGACPNGDGDSPNVINRTLVTTAPTGPTRCKDSLGINFNGGNPYSTIGTWSLTLP